nr:hypothetical protein [Mycobacterium tuberculosis]
MYGASHLKPADSDAAAATIHTSVRVVVRPSGTEPKLKCYLEIRCAPSDDLDSSRRRAGALRAELVAAMRGW